jgi:nucleoside phosphorylase
MSYMNTAIRSQDKIEYHQREFLTSHAGCDNIEFAIICALPVEAGAVQSLLERRDGMPKLKKQKGDPIMYTAGYFGQHRVVLAHMGTKGNINACRVAQYCKGSFPGVKFMMVVGICGAVPTNDPDDDPILGDAIIGTAVAQTDFGTYYEDGFTATSRIVDMLGRSSIEVSSKISWLQTDENSERIRQRAAGLVKELQRRGHPSAMYPGTQHDKLYVPAYIHADDGKKCSEICTGATIERSRLAYGEPEHAIHFGLFGSGNQVIRSTKARDQLLQRLNIKAVEMESAGVWDVCPCIVVKSACDYADSHKMKDFQRYAATTAAATVRAILEFWDE